ncbi:hypothetical protein F8M41_007121 [Gigaspora margarita]|uniref:Uncharacterized protein n=1 Tax=Gigaspora margarita TaxID=4874 RepID=A0A8H3X5I7_GIGMA|nr:hypothetical protein F8M41_007121 [Gigaspora margarita]
MDLVHFSIDTYDSLPIQIGWNLSVKKIDTFFERQDVLGSLAHYQPRGRGKPSAPDISIYPSLPDILKFPQLTNQEDPTQESCAKLQYCKVMWVRAVGMQIVVVGVKIYSPRATRNANEQLDRCMIARLWTHQEAPVPGKHTAVATGTPTYKEANDFQKTYYARMIKLGSEVKALVDQRRKNHQQRCFARTLL